MIVYMARIAQVLAGYVGVFVLLSVFISEFESDAERAHLAPMPRKAEGTWRQIQRKWRRTFRKALSAQSKAEILPLAPAR